MKAYLNDGIIGNKEVKIGLTHKGEIVRLCYPNIDYRQFIDFMHMGVKINDSNIIYLHDDPNNMYFQEYIQDTNILVTNIKNMYFNLRMEQTDFVCINNNVIVRKYVFSNEHEIPLDIKFLVHSKIKSDSNEYVGTRVIENGMVQYSKSYNIAILSNDLKLDSHKINGTDEVIQSGILYDKDYIGMSNNAAISFDIGRINPNEKREFSILMFVCDNKEQNFLSQIDHKIEQLKKIDTKKELQNTKQYWKKYVKEHIVHEIEENSVYKEKVNNIYKRTILLYPLLSNTQTGGIAAAMEIDEEFLKCRKVLILLATRFFVYYKSTRFNKNG